ncbi:MAG: hypothetical protein NC311_05715 [Muribaculaceae bacterium]|nr:hypothetical protein [Muribaculaceae bacterium]
MIKQKNLSYLEYHRRVFNKALSEAFCRIHERAVGADSPEDKAMAARLCEAFFSEELSLPNSTVATTKARLSESVSFIKDCVETAEHIADDKMDDAKEEKMEIPAEQEVELSDEDEAVLDQLFDCKCPNDVQIKQIRDATVAALMAEDEKAAEIRDAVDVAKAQASTDADQATALEETVNRLNGRGPTSLMHAIMNNVTANAIKSVNEAGNMQSVGAVMSENSEKIRARACMIYSLFEMASCFGITKYTETDVKRLAHSIYYEK